VCSLSACYWCSDWSMADKTARLRACVRAQDVHWTQVFIPAKCLSVTKLLVMNDTLVLSASWLKTLEWKTREKTAASMVSTFEWIESCVQLDLQHLSSCGQSVSQTAAVYFNFSRDELWQWRQQRHWHWQQHSGQHWPMMSAALSLTDRTAAAATSTVAYSCL